uniref:Uncharacterized protein n=1 Tax=Sphaerodactylus townsendi TaxID=933632 RepID=A0ACB8EDK8_9SAUR
MSNGTQPSKLSPNTVAQEMIQGYQKAPNTGVLMDEGSLQVEDYSGLCLLKPSSLVLLNGVSDNLKNYQGGQNGSWDNSHLGTKESFPWHITVLKDGDPVCQGSMVTEKWVLSIASCVTSSNVSSYSIQFGGAEKRARRGDGYSVAEIIPHGSKSQEDLVLIRLARSAPISPFVHPICLPDLTRVAPAGTRCQSLGSKENGDSDILQWTVTSASGCLLHSSSSTSVCAQMNDLTKKTQMTAGGPFVCPGENEQLYLEGVVPSATENQNKPMNTQQPAIFARVAPLVPWIKSQVLP